MNVSVRNLEKSFGARTLFAEATFVLNAGERYGLVGSNGSGKTTFLKIMAGDEAASGGVVSMPQAARVGVLRQDRFLSDEAIVVELAMAGDDEVTELLRTQERLLTEERVEEAVQIEERVRLLDGYTLRARASSVLEGLGIVSRYHEGPLSHLSGGMKLRVLLAQVLIGRPDVLLLDEPTNHLDIVSIRWLEKFLQNYQGCAVVISHDQRFIDGIATYILDVDYETITPYRGNYTAFERGKAERFEQKRIEIERAQAKIAEKREFIERFGAKASKAKQAQSIQKQIDRIEVDTQKSSSRREPVLRIKQERPSGRDVLVAEGIDKAYGEKRVLRGVKLSVMRGQRVGIIGKNGLGKSTLLKILIGRETADTGAATWGHEVRVGYFPQDHKDLFPNPDETVLDYLWAQCPKEGTSYVRGELGRALFSGDDVHKKISSLSGGEAARLLFARLSVDRPNVLVLDEPTNHLDLEAISALAEALATFEGTVFFVSHNRWFVSRVATRIVEIKEEGITDYPGDYEEYLAREDDAKDHLDSDSVVRASKEAAKQDRQKSDAPGGGWEEQKRRRNRLKVIERDLAKVTAEMAIHEARASAIRSSYAEDGFFERTSAARVAELDSEEKLLSQKVDGMFAEWEMLETEKGELERLLSE